ncbi:hypothetical protein EHW66_17965 [Erwinia psidii]|uniref:hypothetical protein n=1 Tax=Erwinia psidii TaxID=69224 RepID=UPI00226B47F8|nr:hypothetical protein [Erwinia psidii]MCX8966800.1 hypothetical protein [Erwinia psidii]
MAGNLKLDSNWDIIIGRGATRISGADFVAQLVKSRLLTLLGEWQADTSIGLPWFEGLLGKNTKPSDIQVAISNLILSTTQVSNVNYVTVTPDYKARTVLIEFSADSIYGTIENTITYV